MYFVRTCINTEEGRGFYRNMSEKQIEIEMCRFFVEIIVIVILYYYYYIIIIILVIVIIRRT